MEDMFTCLLDCDKSWIPEWVCKLKIDSFRSNAYISLSDTSTPTTEKAGSSFSSTVKDPESAEDDDDNAFETIAVDTKAADCRRAEAKQRLEESLAKPKPTKKKGKIQRTILPSMHKSKRQAPMTEKMKSMKKEEQAKARKRKAKVIEQEEKGTQKKAKTAAAARAEKQLEEDRANETDSDDDNDDEEDDDMETTEQQDVLYTSPSSGKKYTKVYAEH
jgi:hypothetical protein